ncbi:MAG: precorrin-2 C(20)-methyltransferase [Gammaproteobacteria bacterium]|nr:precorrin-2 C(20)-methyltransferase [Gammaproteobacteria bacterium]
MSGVLYGLGVGPGDPELLTLKAHRLLGECRVVAYPAPDDGQSFARSIVAPYLRPDHLEIPIIIPMRSERFPAQNVYDQASLEISAHLDARRDVAVLCEGDPFFYGSFMYLFERLSAKYTTQIVPGVSSLMASAAAIGRPIAARNDVFSVIPAPLDDDVIARRLEEGEAIAFIKIGRHFNRICNLIDKAGLTGSAGYIERVSLGNEKIMALGDVSGRQVPYFSMILIYKGAEDWIGKLPLLESCTAGNPDQTALSQPETGI